MVIRAPQSKLLRLSLLYPKQQQFRQSKAFLKGFVGGRGTGKTVIGARDVFHSAVDGDDWTAVSPTYGMMEETTFPAFLETVRTNRALIHKRVASPPKIVFRPPSGGAAQIVFRSGEDPDTLRGPNKAGAWIDEASLVQKECLTILMGTLRQKQKSGKVRPMGQIRLTFTPKGRSHWTFSQFFQRVDDVANLTSDQIIYFGNQAFVRTPNTCLVHAHSRENPFLPPEFVEMIGGTITQQLARQELGGEFVDIAGLMFARDNFRFVPESQVPLDVVRVRYWDQAATPGSGKYTAGVRMAMSLQTKRFYVEHVVRGQWGPAERDAKMLEWAKVDAAQTDNTTLVYIEQEGGSAGVEVAHNHVIRMAGFPVYIDKVSGSRYRTKDGIVVPGPAKVIRAMPLSAQVEVGNVYLVAGQKWADDYLDELVSFPESAFSDQVDASSGAINKLIGQDFGPSSPVESLKLTLSNTVMRINDLLSDRRKR